VLPHFIGDPDPRLERFEATPAPPSRDVWLLVHRDLRRVPLVRAVMEFLTDCIKPR
jgi:DNA-binding transcriptional LysR family regulator